MTWLIWAFFGSIVLVIASFMKGLPPPITWLSDRIRRKAKQPQTKRSEPWPSLATQLPPTSTQTTARLQEARAGAQDYFIPALAEVIAEAGLDHALIWPAREALRAALASGDSRALDRALRPVLPEAIWPWPGYEKWAKLVGQKPTRLRMVAAAADMLLHKMAAQERMAQLLENTDCRPYWQLRSAGDAADWPACAKATGRIERWDSRYWQTHGPQQCPRVGCRCTIRAYSLQDLVERGIAVPK